MKILLVFILLTQVGCSAIALHIVGGVVGNVLGHFTIEEIKKEKENKKDNIEK